MVSIDELHEYAKRKVQEAAPAMKPEIYAVKEGYKIHLSQAPTQDPKLRYRKEVEHFASRGVISAVGRSTLDALRDGLGVLLEDATTIEDEVLKPYREYQKKLQRYEQVLVEAIQREHSLNSDTLYELKRLQRVLKLRDEDIAQIEAQITSHKKTVQLSGEPVEVHHAQPLFRSEDVAPAKPSNKAEAASPAKTPKPPEFRLPRVPIISVPVLRNSKLLIGAGIVTTLAAVALTFNFLVKTPQHGQKVEPDYTAYINGGFAKYHLGDNQGAIVDFNQAIQLKPYDVTPHINRGSAKSDLGDKQSAIAHYNQQKETPWFSSQAKARSLAKPKKSKSKLKSTKRIAKRPPSQSTGSKPTSGTHSAVPARAYVVTSTLDCYGAQARGSGKCRSFKN